ncbi:hypothetical protein niasHT_019706 [Heterodera trifolii]|uniref:TNFR-Cys domain-containing protein n=1 Tax=Heterodera trifolii TaxID=157864 RepID=A0ABD2LBX4_9BILA
MRLASLFSVLLFLLFIHRTIPSPSPKFDEAIKDNGIFAFDSSVEDSAEGISPSPAFADSLRSPHSSEAEEDGPSAEEEEGFVDNVAGWRPRPSFPHFAVQNRCPKSKFFDSKSDECRPCSICGPDLYEREKCRTDSDTVCEWCLTNLRVIVRNNDFHVKCEQLIALRDQFRAALAQHSVVQGKEKPTIYSVSMFENASKLWKIELFVEMAFYITLIALVLAVIRFLVKSRSNTTYRTVTVTPPMLEEWEQKNIVRAAESIREKMGGKGYAKLDEEFI